MCEQRQKSSFSLKIWTTRLLLYEAITWMDDQTVVSCEMGRSGMYLLGKHIFTWHKREFLDRWDATLEIASVGLKLGVPIDLGSIFGCIIR